MANTLLKLGTKSISHIISPHKNKPNKEQTNKAHTFLVTNTTLPTTISIRATYPPAMMAPSKTTPSPPPSPPPPHHHYYSPLPPQPQDQNYTLSTYYYSSNPKLNWRIICTISILLLALVVFILWPSDPVLKIERLHLTHVQIHTKPCICLDISMNVTLKVHNVDVYSIDFKSLDVAVGYRGKRLGHVKSDHGHVRALGSSHVEAELQLDCVEVLSDVVFLLEDLARGTVPIDTVTEISGRFGLFFLGFPLKAKVSCEVLVNTTTQTIARQNCYRQ